MAFAEHELTSEHHRALHDEWPIHQCPLCRFEADDRRFKSGADTIKSLRKKIEALQSEIIDLDKEINALTKQVRCLERDLEDAQIDCKTNSEAPRTSFASSR